MPPPAFGRLSARCNSMAFDAGWSGAAQRFEEPGTVFPRHSIPTRVSVDDWSSTVFNFGDAGMSYNFVNLESNPPQACSFLQS